MLLINILVIRCSTVCFFKCIIITFHVFVAPVLTSVEILIMLIWKLLPAKLNCAFLLLSTISHQHILSQKYIFLVFVKF